eukprot:m.105196 g.105196  ORF g.105196 m.105196 type:complete len:1037 (-) comp9125_c0_seq1:2437-5547(-)
MNIVVCVVCVVCVGCVGCVAAAAVDDGGDGDGLVRETVVTESTDVQERLRHLHTMHSLKQAKLALREKGLYDSFHEKDKSMHPTVSYESMKAHLHGVEFLPHLHDSEYDIFVEPFKKADISSGSMRNRREDSCNSNTIDVSKIESALHQFPPDTIYISFAWIGRVHGGVVALLEFETNIGAPNLYCSSDYGQSYALCEGVDKPISQLHKVVVDDKTTWIFALTSNSPSQYSDQQDFSRARGFYLSKDNGETFTFKPADHHFDRIIPNPRSPHEMLGFILDEDHADYYVDDVYYVSSYSVGGSTSVRIEEHVFYADWTTSSLAQDSDDVLITRYRNEPGTVPDEVEPLDLIRVSRPGQRTQITSVIKSDCYDFEEQGEFLFATEVPSSDGFDERKLHVSTDDGSTFDEAIFPFAARHNHFKIVDATEGVAFVLVQHTITRIEGETFVFRIDGPESIAGNYSASKGLFTPLIDGGVMQGEIFIETQNVKGCSDKGGVSQDSMGKIILLQRGDCPFVEKVLNAQSAGAVGVVIINFDDQLDFRMSGEDGVVIDIPAFMVGQTTGEAIINEQANSGFEIHVSLIEESVKERALKKKSNVFVSDSTGIRYSLSLPDVLYIPYYTETGTEIADFHKMVGQEGTYFASQLLTTLDTFLTINKGGSWEKIYAKGCGHGDCRMTLALDSSYATVQVPLPLSTPSASGIVLANAQSYDAEAVSLYVSLDSGITWKKALNGPQDYQILDHGGVLVSVPARSTSTSVSFSVDYGATWSDFSVVPEATNLQITTELGGATLVFYVYHFDGEWIGQFVDFEKVFNGPCFIGTPGSSKSDYDIFTPGTQVGDLTCLLGREIKFLRRKQCTRCYNGLDHEQLFDDDYEEGVVTCPCNSVNYICAPGFSRSSSSSLTEPCTYDAAYADEIQCSSDHGFVEALNYMRVNGDQCQGGNENDFQITTKIACTSTKDHKMGVVAVVVVFMLILVAMSIVLYRAPHLRVRLFEVAFGMCKRNNAVGFSQMYSTSTVNADLIDSDDEALIGIDDGSDTD